MYCDHNMNLIPGPAEIAEPREGVCPVDRTLEVTQTAAEANCGKSVMCRDGMTQLTAIIRDITTGRGQPDDLPLIREICGVIKSAVGCGLAERAADYIMASLDQYGGEWEAHCRRKRCAALVCHSYYNVYIDPAVCKGCGACIKTAPQGAVAGGDGLVSVIKDDAGIKTAEFIALCQNSAIKKYGAVKPHIPDEPAPVGSAASGERRSRRRNIEN